MPSSRTRMTHSVRRRARAPSAAAAGALTRGLPHSVPSRAHDPLLIGLRARQLAGQPALGITSTRSLIPRTSGSSLEIIRTARPGAELVDQLVDLDLGADVDTARRLVEDQQPGVRRQPLADHDLLLVAAGEGAGAGPDRSSGPSTARRRWPLRAAAARPPARRGCRASRARVMCCGRGVQHQALALAVLRYEAEPGAHRGPARRGPAPCRRSRPCRRHSGRRRRSPGPPPCGPRRPARRGPRPHRPGPRSRCPRRPARPRCRAAGGRAAGARPARPRGYCSAMSRPTMRRISSSSSVEAGT